MTITSRSRKFMRCEVECGKRSTMAGRALRIDPKSDLKTDRKDRNTTVDQVQGAAALDPNEIAIRSYELWLQRGCPLGSPEVDWFKAESELTAEIRGNR
jgi:hypothetical protein